VLPLIVVDMWLESAQPLIFPKYLYLGMSYMLTEGFHVLTEYCTVENICGFKISRLPSKESIDGVLNSH